MPPKAKKHRPEVAALWRAFHSGEHSSLCPANCEHVYHAEWEPWGAMSDESWARRERWAAADRGEGTLPPEEQCTVCHQRAGRSAYAPGASDVFPEGGRFCAPCYLAEKNKRACTQTQKE